MLYSSLILHQIVDVGHRRMFCCRVVTVLGVWSIHVRSEQCRRWRAGHLTFAKIEYRLLCRLKRKLHYFDLLWILCTTNPQQIHSFLWICCTTCDQHNKRGDALDPRLLCWSQVRRHVKMLWICCTRTFVLLWICCELVLQHIRNKSK